MHMTLTPAYGRDYKSRKAIVADLRADRDFLCNADENGPLMRPLPINRPQILEKGVKTINVRYKQLRSVCVIKVAEIED